MSDRILVINPNSSATVTDDIARALDEFRFKGGPTIDCLTLAEGPPGIETQRHVDEVVSPLCRMIERESADAFVIACFSDPGLHAAREATSTPVFGIAQCGILAALARGEAWHRRPPGGLDPRHRATSRRSALSERMAGERGIGIGVTGLAQEQSLPAPMTDGGRGLRDEARRDVIVLGSRRHGALPGPAEAHLGCPVDPSAAALAWARHLRSLN